MESPAVAPSLPPAAPDENAFTYQTVTGTHASIKAGQVLVNVMQNQHSPRTGFIPMRLSVTNGLRPQKLKLLFSSSESGHQVTTQTLELAGDERRTLLFPVPVCPWGTLEVRTDSGESSSLRMYFTRDDHLALLWVGSDAQIALTAGPPPTTETPKVSITPLAAQELSGELSTLVGFDAIFLVDTRLEELSQAQARALEAYAATGGLLTLFRKGPGTASRLPLLNNPAADSEERQTYGFGNVRACNGLRTPCVQEALRDVLHHVPTVRPADTPDFRHGLRYSGSYGASLAERFLLKQAYPPVGRFLIFIFLFTALIGPGSLVIARRRGPAMLLFTIPATSLVSCVLILCYSILVDGFAIYARTVSVSLLDRPRARVLTAGVGGFYANLSPPALRFGALSSVVMPSDERLNTSVDWSDGATFGSDLIPSRTYLELGFLSVDPSRARLVFQSETQKVQNSLGGRIRRACVYHRGQWITVHDVPEGGEALATPLAEPWTWPWKDRDLEEPMKRLQPGNVLTREPREGSFIAVLDGPGSLPLGGLIAQHVESAQIVYGEVE